MREPLTVRRGTHEETLADPRAVDEAVVLRRLLDIISGAVAAFVWCNQGQQGALPPAGVHGLRALFETVAQLPLQPSSTQMSLFAFFDDLLALVTASSMETPAVVAWLTHHEVTDVASAWQQYDWIAREQLVKVALSRAAQLLGTWDDWLPARHNVAVLADGWGRIMQARELAGPRPSPRAFSTAQGRSSPRQASPAPGTPSQLSSRKTSPPKPIGRTASGAKAKSSLSAGGAGIEAVAASPERERAPDSPAGPDSGMSPAVAAAITLLADLPRVRESVPADVAGLIEHIEETLGNLLGEVQAGKAIVPKE